MKVVASFLELCQNQHNLSFADEVLHPQFVNHYMPEGRPIEETPGRPAAGFQRFYGMLQGFPDATMHVDEQLAERDLVARRKTSRGTHTGQLWTSMDLQALRADAPAQIRPPPRRACAVGVSMPSSLPELPMSVRRFPLYKVQQPPARDAP